MADHVAAQLAFQARLRTLSVVTTGSTTLSATATGYARAAGSFLTDGFAVGMEVTPTGFTQTTVGVIDAVTALTMTIDGGRIVQAAAAGRTLAVGLPTLRAWDNVAIDPVVGQPFIEEEYVPATSEAVTIPALGGTLRDTGLYVLRWYSRQGTGSLALRQPADAILALFKPGTALAVGSAFLRVSSKTAPWAGQIRTTGDGWAVVTVTIPWWWDNVN